MIAACIWNHPHHAPAAQLFERIRTQSLHACTSTHGLAEFYSAITRTPYSPRVLPAEAIRLLENNFLPALDLIPLSSSDYKRVLREMAALGIAGGAIYDALHLRCAEKANCERIYTFNVRDFRSLASAPDLAAKIMSP